MTAPVRRVDIPASLGELWQRVQILEAVRPGGGGDYQFLDEAISVAGDQEFSLAIPLVMPDGRAYRHLVVEVEASYLVGSETPALPADIDVSIDKEYTFAPQVVYADDVDPTVPYATRATDNQIFVTLEKVIAFSDQSVSTDVGYTSRLTFHFPYSQNGDPGSVGGTWSAVGFGYLNGPAPYGGSFVSGGLITDPGLGAIEVFAMRGSTRSTFASFTGAWSSVTTYNLGDAVSYLGANWISLDTNLNEAPVPPHGGAHWETYWREFTEGSKISAYGIF